MNWTRFASFCWIGIITFGFGLLIQRASLNTQSSSALKPTPDELRTFEGRDDKEIKKSVETGFKFAGVYNDEEVVHFWEGFQRAIAMGDKESAAKFANYPLDVNFYDDAIEESYRKINSKKAFIRHFDSIFDTALKKLVAKTLATDLKGNYHGIRIPRGEIWLGVFCVDEKKDCSKGYKIRLRTIHGNSVSIDRDPVN